MATAAPATSEPRKDLRKRVLMRGVVFSASGAAMVWIRNISSEGAQVAADDPLEPDCDVILKRGPIFAAARVVRSDSNGAGLQFYRHLDPALLLSARIPLPHRDD